MSKSPKPRHFSDSSCERWDKNRHGQRTKSYLRKGKKEKRRDEWRRKVVEKMGHVYRSACVCLCGCLSVYVCLIGKWKSVRQPCNHASLSNGGAEWVTDIASLSGEGNPNITIFIKATEEQCVLALFLSATVTDIVKIWLDHWNHWNSS